MAYETAVSFGTMALMLGDGATSEDFTAPCGITSLTKTTNVNVAETTIFDCDDIDLLGQIVLDEISRNHQISFGGLMNVEALPTWRAWDDAGGFKNIRWFRDLTSGNGGGYNEGAALLTAFEEQGQREDGKWQISGTVRISGAFPFTPAS
jgi:hypothetical protein